MSIRPIKRIVKAKPTREGAGVHLRRAFGFGNVTGDVEGLQFGVVIATGSIHGLQIGLINVIERGGWLPVLPIINGSKKNR